MKFTEPYFDENEVNAVVRALRSGQWATGGEVSSLERDFSALMEARHAVAVSSGTAALWAAFAALGIKEGDKVAVPAFSFVASANCILYCGAQPVFVDVDSRTGNVCMASLEEVLKAQEAKAVIAVHLYGCPLPMNSLMGLVRRYGVYLVEDCAQALGTHWGGKAAGTFGDAGCFSFYPTKMVASGEGGMIVTPHAQVALSAREFINHGQTSRYNHTSLGYNLRQSDLHASVARVQLKRLSRAAEARQDMASNYDRTIQNPLVKKPIPVPGHAWNLYTIRCHHREAIQHHLKDSGIPTAIHYKTSIPGQPMYKRLGYDERGFPNACSLAREVLSLPLHPGLKTADQKRVVEAVNSFGP